MARALRIQYPGAYYHVTCRGNERKDIFHDNVDQKIFLEKLALSLEIYHVSLLSYACMSNHFHLLVTTPNGNLSEFMRHFNISYTSAFNKRHKRVGHLYQGRYKSFLIDADDYLLEVSRYMHLNPVRLKVFAKMSPKEKWEALVRFEGTSLPGYLSSEKRQDFIDYEMVLSHMGGDNRSGRKQYQQFIRWAIDNEIDNPLKLGKGHGIVGKNDFIQWVKEKFVNKEAPSREQPAMRELGRELQPERLIDHFAALVDKDKEELCQRGRHSLERSMLMELLYRYGRLSQPEIGRLVGGVDYSAVSQARKRLQVKLERERKLKRRFEQIARDFSKLSRIKI